ncbi:hypothetical protein V6R21_07000 [Limibacter armeniacum]|uniref:hypothetical protein n=1 Tax=Limibacter armeniacum TaxID=466084 RepID=UPI002FE59028
MKKKNQPAVKHQVKKLTPEDQFKRLQEAVRKKKLRNIQLRHDLDMLIKRYESEVKAEELGYFRRIYNLADWLIGLAADRQLLEWERTVLMRWVSELIDGVSRYAYANELNMKALYERFRQLYSQHQVEILRPHEKKRLRDAFRKFVTEQTGLNLEQLFTEDELEKLFLEPMEFVASVRAKMQERNEREEELRFEAKVEAQHKVDKDVDIENKIMARTTSLNTLFKKLAKVLHPDTQTDEQKKAELHHQMSELMDAKKNHDLMKVITLYRKHFDELDFTFSEEDMIGFNTMLKKQEKQLDWEFEMLKYHDGIRSRMFKAFYAYTRKSVDRKFEEYLTIIRAGQRELEKEFVQAQSIKELKQFIKMIRDSSAYHDDLMSALSHMYYYDRG